MYQSEGVSCVNVASARGLCLSHYVGYRYHVKKGNTTWKELEKKGLCKKMLSQVEKNIKQMHPHKTYNQKNPKFDF